MKPPSNAATEKTTNRECGKLTNARHAGKAKAERGEHNLSVEAI